MRTFIAIELPESIKAQLAKVQRELAKSNADVKWVAPENIHLTLKFLGERDDKKIKKITEVIEETGKTKKAYCVKLSSLGGFPKIDYPRVIWAGMEQGDPETKGIAEELEGKIAKLGIPKEDRPFSSHITIGRVRSPLNRKELVENLKMLLPWFQKQNLEFCADKITLFKSTLSPKGPTYEPLKTIILKAS